MPSSCSVQRSFSPRLLVLVLKYIFELGKVASSTAMDVYHRLGLQVYTVLGQRLNVCVCVRRPFSKGHMQRSELGAFKATTGRCVACEASPY